MATKNYSGFYVYTHARPDGSVFYIGKGRGRRAWDLSPSRRSLHHRNITTKHGLDAIVVSILPVPTEDAAFSIERAMIADHLASGFHLTNFTKGGEGCSGRPVSATAALGLAKGRLDWHARELNDASKARILAGMSKGRISAAMWRQSPEGVAHIRSLGAISAAATAARSPVSKVCEVCNSPFETKSLKNVRWCGKVCGLRGWRMKKAA